MRRRFSTGSFKVQGIDWAAHTVAERVPSKTHIRALASQHAVGLCAISPSFFRSAFVLTTPSFFHQQHRWCLGNVVMIVSKKFWRAHIPSRIKFCYLTGFLYNLHYPFIILFSFQLFWTLFLYSEYVTLQGAALFYPYILFSLICVTIFPLSGLRFGYFYAHIMKAYSNTHAVLSMIFNISVGWVATNSKHTAVSPAFRQTTRLVGLYVVTYASLTILAVWTGDLHLSVYRYWSLQFWIFWNLTLSVVLLWQLNKTMRHMAG